MLRIGEIADQYGISRRTLRYWEANGILESVRGENGYRYYDAANMLRVRQIAGLRGLKLSISDIERVFLSRDVSAVKSALGQHLINLRQDARRHQAVIDAMERLLAGIKNATTLEQALVGFAGTNAAIKACAVIETNAVIDNQPEQKPYIQLSERKVIMNEERLTDVRIVCIPALTVAAYRAVSETPEEDCGRVFNPYVLENNLHKRAGYRHFGFNNPSPSAGNPVYGYEMWVTIPDELEVPEPFVRETFPGGLYASISTRMNEIGERWRLLHNWCKSSETYDADFSFQWLEECVMSFEDFISDKVKDSDKQLDLLHPIKVRQR